MVFLQRIRKRNASSGLQIGDVNSKLDTSSCLRLKIFDKYRADLELIFTINCYISDIINFPN